jgi:uncharacterized protein (DUF2147 family)
MNKPSTGLGPGLAAGKNSANSADPRIPHSIKKILIAAAMAAACAYSAAWGQDLTPLGLWKSIDDRTNQPAALIRITEIAGKFQGRIERIFPEPGESANPRCEECEGDLKNQPVVGMIILRDMRLTGDEYTDGRILDPDSGKIYHCSMRILDGGNKLIVRGYVGIPLLGRSQVWLRDQ